MNDCKQVILLAAYNAWMNTKVFEAASRLPHEEVVQDRGAFFGSILGTLNHIAVADTIWLRRFSILSAEQAALKPLDDMPIPTALNTVLFSELAGLIAYRKRLDGMINAWAATLTDADLSRELRYASLKGIASNKRLGAALMHFFNHQTHHRGQATTLLHQAGQDVGITDLIALISDTD
ncbi:diguanylate cyclase [Methylobacillus sp. MM3]|uniref:DinB family protein n=1 Tax=Methylobacillus sp. MM3 TaxID=1848039 RepID=UPI0007DF2559|nr:DinB family protein [Methylobacillus sp. MM3]OAJ70222.1 diguanylate cyclase [Methylobacillus sp. MM3]